MADTTEPFTLRPGDSIVLSLPGENSLNQTVQIHRDGKILLPEVGEAHLQGLTLPQATELIKNRLSEVIHDLARFEVILKERRLMVNVLGYVKQPGMVVLAQGSSIQEAISAAQGLIPGAQLDKLQVRRDNEVVHFDYKHYLDSGDLSVLPSLQPLDTIFVPASPLIGNVQIDFDARTLTASGDAGESDKAVTVFGEVIKPGTFSYKNDATVVDLIMRAGGVTRYAGVEKIRVISSGNPVMFDLKKYLDSGDKSILVDVAPGDTIFVPKEVDDVKSGLTVVYVMGEVFKPGAYEAASGVSFLDILANAGGPTRFAESRQIRIIRHDGNVTPFDLQQFTEGSDAANIPKVSPGDAIFVPEKNRYERKILVENSARTSGKGHWRSTPTGSFRMV
jgi:protein involved in polysaccharide export with SLBB domain